MNKYHKEYYPVAGDRSQSAQKISLSRTLLGQVSFVSATGSHRSHPVA